MRASTILVLWLITLLNVRPTGGQAIASRQLSATNKATDPYPIAAALADRRQDAAAMEMLRPLAEGGHVQAGLLLGQMHARGWGVPASRAEGLAWVRKAAAAADAEGQAFVALHFLFGDDFPGYDEAEALRWFRAAAQRGSARGAFGLGLMYKHGRGVPRDDALAARWFRQAAIGGLAPAVLMLATLHANPSSPLHDPAQAQRHFRNAALAGGADLFRNWANAYEGGPAEWYPVPVDRAEAARLRGRADALAGAGTPHRPGTN